MAIQWTELRKELIGDSVSAIPPNFQLPMLPSAVLEFSRKADDPKTTPVELGRIIDSDSGLTAELLRYANSAAVGLREKSRTPHQAISMLGIRPTKLYLLSYGVQNAMKSCQSKLINIKSFWFTNLERGFVAKQVAALLRTDVDVAFSASMLHDFLLPVLTNQLFNEYLRFGETPEKVRRPLVEFEQETFGWDHCRATAHVLMEWQFPDDLICAVLLHHGGLAVLADPELGRTPVAAVAVAALLPDPMRQTRDGLDQLQHLHEIWPEFDLPEIAKRAAAQLVAMTPEAAQHVTLQRRLEKLTATIAAK